MRSAKIFYGWYVILTGGVLYVTIAGLYWSGLSFYYLPVSQDLGISPVAISLAFGLQRLTGGINAPLSGYLVDRFGARRMIPIGGTIAGIGFILFSMVSSYLTFLIVLLGLMSIGFSTGYDQGVLSSPNRWFIRHRARALSYVMAGARIGTLGVAPVVGLMVVHIGWKPTALISGVAVLVVVWVSCIIIRNFPEDMGLMPDGDTLSDGNYKTGQDPKLLVSTQPQFTALEGYRTPTYWILAVAMGLRVGAYIGFLVHFVPIMVWKGRSEVEAALLMFILGSSALFMVLIMGLISDKYPKKLITSISFSLGGVGLFVVVSTSGNLWQLMIAMAFVAIADSASVAAWGHAGDIFGRKAFASLMGGMIFVFSLLSAVTPIMAGWIYGSTGTYQPALIIIMGMFIGASALFLAIPNVSSSTSISRST